MTGVNTDSHVRGVQQVELLVTNEIISAFNRVTVTDSYNGIVEIKYVQFFFLTAVIIKSSVPFIIACFLLCVLTV